MRFFLIEADGEPLSGGGTREARLTGLVWTGAAASFEGPLAALAELAEVAELSVAPASATATAVPATVAAPMPNVTAPAPSQAYGEIRRCLATEKLPRVIGHLP